MYRNQRISIESADSVSSDVELDSDFECKMDDDNDIMLVAMIFYS